MISAVVFRYGVETGWRHAKEQIISNKLEMAIESDIAEVARMIDEVEVFGERRRLRPRRSFS